MKSRRKRLMMFMFSFVLAGSMYTQTANAYGKSDTICVAISAKSGKSVENVPKNAQEIVDDMGIGFNIGKVFSQSIPSNMETYEKTVDAAVAEGFETIRIPTNWAEHIDADGHLTDEAYAQKVKASVKYAMDKGVYVILNSHEDLGFSENSYWDLSQVTTDQFKTQYTNLWTDIAKLFPYDEFGYHLLFEVTNEPKNYEGPVFSGYQDYQNISEETRKSLSNDGWYFAGRCGNLKYMETLNEMFASLMKDVAPERYYLITSYNANIIAATEEYSNKNISYGTAVHEDINYHGWGNNYLHMPSVNKEKAILSIHIYDINQWDDYLGRLKTSMNANHIDIPVYIGETGMHWANKETSGPLLKKMLAFARENHISAAIWDDSQSMGYINRTTGEWYDKSFMDEIVEAGKSKKMEQPTEPTTEATTEKKTTERPEEKTTEVTTEERSASSTTEEKATTSTTEKKLTDTKKLSKSRPKKVTKLKLKLLKSRRLKVTWKKEKSIDGYQVVYATNKKFKSKKVKSCKTAGVVLKKVKNNKTYYVKVRAYRKINGEKIYGSWSKVQKMKIKK